MLLKLLFQNCWLCGFPSFRALELCSFCEKHIPNQTLNFKNLPLLELQGFALWEWSNNKNTWCKYLIYNLKNKAPTKIHSWLIRRLLKGYLLMSSKNVSGQKVVIIPSPPSKNSKYDHASSLAEVLSKTLKVPLLDCLVRETEGQKNKSREQRKTVEIGIKKAQRLAKNASYIFVDDVVTTGSTAKAAWQALGKPPHFQVWALVYRSACFDKTSLV